MPPLTFDEIATRDASRFLNSGAGFAVFTPVGNTRGEPFKGTLSRHIDQVESAQSGKSVYTTMIHAELIRGVSAGDTFRSPSGEVWEVNSVEASGGLLAMSVSRTRSVS